jgi:hypothetical protein
MKERNPQAEQMADESMLRNLAAQADAIWPQEQRLFDRYRLPTAAQIADIGRPNWLAWTSWKVRSPMRAAGMHRWPRACGSSRAMRSS